MGVGHPVMDIFALKDVCSYIFVHSDDGKNAKQISTCKSHNDDYLEDKREDYQNCSALHCAPQLFTVISTLQ